MTRAEQQPVGLAVTQSSSHRRRWLRIAVVAVIAAAIGITLANDWFPRLNTAEKRIVGEWTFADLAGRPISHHVRFARDRTFFLWSSDHTTERGTWKASDEELIFSTDRPELSTPMTGFRWMHSVFDRIQNPQPWAPHIDYLAVEELSESAMRLRTADGTKVVYHRGVPAGD